MKKLHSIPFQWMSSREAFSALIPTSSGQFVLSIVAGTSMYSSPRLTLDDPSEYSEAELAVFRADTGKWATYDDLKDTGIFELIGYGEYGHHRHPHDIPEMSCAVFPYVPVEDLKKVWAQL